MCLIALLESLVQAPTADGIEQDQQQDEVCHQRHSPGRFSKILKQQLQENSRTKEVKDNSP